MLDPNKISKIDSDFDKLLLKAIDEALTNIGENSKKIILFHIYTKYHVLFEEIPKKPELFVLALKSLIGLGSEIIESMIIQKLCNFYGINCDCVKKMPFLDCLSQIKAEVKRNGLTAPS